MQRDEALRGWRPVAKGAVRADSVVVVAPLLDDDLSFLERVEDLAIEKLITKACIEALNEAGTTRTLSR